MTIKCKWCDGTGLETDQNGVQKNEPCPICDGSGKFDYDDSDSLGDKLHA